MSEWKECTLDKISSYINRGFSPQYVESNGNLIINQRCIRNGRIDLSYAKLVNKNKTITLEKVLQKGDILINSTGVGTAGRVGIFNYTILATVDSHITIIRIDENKANPLFVFYNLRSRELDIESFAEGSTGQIELSRERVKIINLLLPPLPEQKAIAGVLSSLDDKIDLLHRQNKTLEAMAETLFRKWFVEDADKWWEDGTIANLIDFNPSRKLVKGVNVPYLEMAALSTSTFMPDYWYNRVFTSGTKFINGDTLLARITPCLENGKTAYITFLKNNDVAWGSTEYIVMRPKAHIHTFFAYILARTKEFRDYAEGCLEGSSGRQRVNIDHLKDYEIAQPNRNVIEKFNSHSELIVPKLISNMNQIQTLEKLRDTLLPKLMSGEVRMEF